jgi:hypothetical protein
MIEMFIKRDILKDLRNDLDKKEMAFLIGPRQSGKTTLMKVLQRELEEKNERTLFLSLDFENLENLKTWGQATEIRLKRTA